MRKRNKLGKRKLQFEAVEGRDAPTTLFPVAADDISVDLNPVETMSFGDDDTVPGGDGDDSVGGGNGDDSVGGGNGGG